MGKEQNVAETKVEVPVEVEAPKRKKQKVLTKDLKTSPGSLILTVVGVEGTVTYNPADLPENVQTELPVFALSHKLGDAASGKSGQEAADAIAKVWEGMIAGNWSVRAPAAKKVSLSTIADNLKDLSVEEQEKAKASLAALGIIL